MRANSTADPAFLKNPEFNDCDVALVYAPLWPFNVGESYGNTLLSFSALAREKAISKDVQIVFEVDGMAINDWFQFYMKPFLDKPVMSLADFSIRDRTAPVKCYEQMIFCFGIGSHTWHTKDPGMCLRVQFYYTRFIG